MSEETRRVLEMVAAGKITVDEGERLLAALGAGQAEPQPVTAEGERRATFSGCSRGASGVFGAARWVSARGSRQMQQNMATML